MAFSWKSAEGPGAGHASRLPGIRTSTPKRSESEPNPIPSC